MNITVDTNYGVIVVIQIDMYLLSSKGTNWVKMDYSGKALGNGKERKGFNKDCLLNKKIKNNPERKSSLFWLINIISNNCDNQPQLA